MVAGAQSLLSGWGRYPLCNSDLLVVGNPAEIEQINTLQFVSRGNGRSYGDASIGVHATLDMSRLNKILSFDDVSGLMTCEAGVLLSDIVELFVPRGWFVPVTPGTKYVTIGGMIASDIHGKNHHFDGSFCQHIQSLDLYVPGQGVLTCSPSQNRQLFLATCGGMGLTGVIVRATFSMISIPTAYIVQNTIRARNIEDALDRLAQTKSTYSVAWVDCLATGRNVGRSVIMDGEHAERHELSGHARSSPFALPRSRGRNVPFDLPSASLNGHLMRIFNSLYYHSRRQGPSVVDLQSYFYPLDVLQNWNRIYGRRGFVQFQFVVPLDHALRTLTIVLNEISSNKLGSFLAVLKQFGDGESGFLSFPREGVTLALDFPITVEALELLRRLEQIVVDTGGRFYLAKDAILTPSSFASGYPKLDEFRDVRSAYGLDRHFQSFLSQRLKI